MSSSLGSGLAQGLARLEGDLFLAPPHSLQLTVREVQGGEEADKVEGLFDHQHCLPRVWLSRWLHFAWPIVLPQVLPEYEVCPRRPLVLPKLS